MLAFGPAGKISLNVVHEPLGGATCGEVPDRVGQAAAPDGLAKTRPFFGYQRKLVFVCA